MRRRLLFRVEAALAGLTDPQVSAVRREAARLRDECGCAMGGVFLWAALLVGTPVLLIARGPSPLTFLVAAIAVLAAAALGKVVGVGVAGLRLLVLVRRVEATAPHGRSAGHVHLH
jgi:hypothetical protein